MSTFEDRFKCALNSNYCRNLQTRDVVKLREIYEGIIGEPYRMSVNCSTCILNLVKRLAPIYFECKEIIENEKSEVIEGKRNSVSSSKRRVKKDD